MTYAVAVFCLVLGGFAGYFVRKNQGKIDDVATKLETDLKVK